MINDWQESTLRQEITIKHGYAFRGEFFTDKATGAVLITPGNFAIGGGFQEPRPKYYDGPIDPGFVLHPGDLVVTMTDLNKSADTLGYPATIPGDTGCIYLHNQRIGKIANTNPKRLDKRFLYYLLCSKPYRHHIVATASGSTVRHTSPNRILDHGFRLPPLPEQRAIAHILGTLDDKIDLNHRMNETLDEIARTLFTSWFVNFDPVRAKAEGHQPEGMDADTAALLPDCFVDSELGLIPDGWPIGRLDNNITVIKGRSYRSEELGESQKALVTLKSFLRGGGYREDGLKGFTGTCKPEQVIQSGEIIVALTDVTQAADVIGGPAIVIPIQSTPRSSAL